MAADSPIEIEGIEAFSAPNNLSLGTLQQDLANRFSARFQIDANLKLAPRYQDYDQRLLQLPLLCIGTGRNLSQLLLAYKTTIQPCDVCLDSQARIQPDHVGDCFHLNPSQLHSPRPFGIIFFAHVNWFGLPMDKVTKKSLQIYYGHLLSGGFLVFNSEVIHKNHLEKLIKHHESPQTFDDLKALWVAMLETIGFNKIEILQKDESHIFPDNISILIIAEK